MTDKAFKCTGLKEQRELSCSSDVSIRFGPSYRDSCYLVRVNFHPFWRPARRQANLAISTLVWTDWMGRMRKQTANAFRAARSEAEPKRKLKMEKEMSSISVSRHIRVTWNPYKAVQSTALSYFHA